MADVLERYVKAEWLTIGKLYNEASPNFGVFQSYIPFTVNHSGLAEYELTQIIDGRTTSWAWGSRLGHSVTSETWDSKAALRELNGNYFGSIDGGTNYIADNIPIGSVLKFDYKDEIYNVYLNDVLYRTKSVSSGSSQWLYDNWYIGAVWSSFSYARCNSTTITKFITYSDHIKEHDFEPYYDKETGITGLYDLNGGISPITGTPFHIVAGSGYEYSEVPLFFKVDGTTLHISATKRSDDYKLWIPGISGSVIEYKDIITDFVADDEMLPKVNVSGMFYNCLGLINIDITPFINCLNTSSLFQGCSNIEHFYIRKNDKVNASISSNMFTGCTKIINYTADHLNASWAKDYQNVLPGEKPTGYCNVVPVMTFYKKDNDTWACNEHLYQKDIDGWHEVDPCYKVNTSTWIGNF